MRVDEAWLAAITEWRRKQDDLPSQSEAIRRLVAKGLGMAKGLHEDREHELSQGLEANE